MTPSISIIVPVYDVQPYLRQCMESLIGQTLHDIEIICVDDGSTDDSPAILAEYAAQDKRVHVFRQTNKGQSAARNFALRYASAPYVMFCDGDDWCEATMCEQMLAAISTSECDIAVCGTQIHYKNASKFERFDHRYYKIKFEGKQLINEFIILHTDVSVWNKIFRKSIIDQYGIRFPDGLKYEDAFFFNAYMMCSRSAFYLQQKLYHYRRRPGSTMNCTFKRKALSSEYLRVATLLDEFCEARQWSAKYSLLLAHLFLKYYADACLFASSKEEEEYLAKAGATFAREHWGNPADLPSSLARKIQLIKLNGRRIVRAFPLKIVETLTRKKIFFFWVPLLNIRYRDDCVKYYLFGCLLIRRYNPLREFPANFTSPYPVRAE